VPAAAQVFPGQKIVLHVTGSEPVAFGAEDPIRSITVTGPGEKVVTSRRFAPDRHRRAQCGTAPLRKTIKLSYVVPAGVHGPLTLTAMSVGTSGRVGRSTITFQVGS
jgi:hypothetical protein